MTSNLRRPQLTSTSRSSSRSQLASDATVLNATALPSRLPHTTSADRLAGVVVAPQFDETTDEKDKVRDSLGRDPFVSISRAIHSARLRAAASLRAPPVSRQRFATLRILHDRASLVARVLLLLGLFLLTASLLWEPRKTSKSEHPHGEPARAATAATTKTSVPFALVADPDRESCRVRIGDALNVAPCASATAWVTKLRRGILTVGAPSRVEWLDSVELAAKRGDLAVNGAGTRALELSELVWFNEALLVVDDRTGAILEIGDVAGGMDDDVRARARNSHAEFRRATGFGAVGRPRLRARARLADGDGRGATGFKAEWAVVRDGKLIVGGHGRPVTAMGEPKKVVSEGPLWVKVVDRMMGVQHENWSEQYAKLANAAGATFPGYLMHEAVVWSSKRREWVFLPRRRSVEGFDARSNEHRGWNAVLVVSEDFTSIRKVEIVALKEEEGSRGFSAAAWVPGSDERVIAAVRTVEMESANQTRVTESFISAFDLDGRIVMSEERVSDDKFEGIAFL